MYWSQTFLHTLRENPADAEITSHQLLVRAGMIRKVAPGIYTYGNFALRAIRRLEAIIREELEAIACNEILMPMVQPKGLWEESGRWPNMGELLKFKNKNDQDFCLGATHEEVITDFVRNDVSSYRDFPISLYQVQTKYRDEIRPRFGLFRGREFIMKDAYTFDRTVEEAHASYDKMFGAYDKIFSRLGLEFCAVEADTGAMGGNKSHEFQVLAEAGMDRLLVCEACNYSSNEEVTPVKVEASGNKSDDQAMEKFSTPGLRTIDDLAKSLGTDSKNLVKTFFVKTVEDEPKTYTLLLPGDYEVNMIKAKKVIGTGCELEMLAEHEVKALTGAAPGSCGPVGLNATVVMDSSLANRNNFIVGANEDDFHLKNVCPERDFKADLVGDIRLAKSGDACPSCSKPLTAKRGIEVGHIFYLGQKYTSSMGVKFLDENGKSQTSEMGCYGIGVSRTMQSAVEQSHDKDGIIWPESIAPFWLHICCLDPKDEAIARLTKDVHDRLTKVGVEVFVDDRKERPGVKFKDADLIGLPYRMVIGKRGVESGELELVNRKTKDVAKVSVDDIFEKLSQLTGKTI